MQILESLGWPNDRGQSPNLLLIAECLTAITKAKKLTPSQAHSYLERAIKLAREQYVTVDRFFFRDGVYMQMRPKKPLPQYTPKTKEYWEETKRQQSGPEWDEMVRKMDQLLKGMTMPDTRGKK